MAAAACDDHSQFLTLECLGETDIISQIISLDKRIFPTPFRINGEKTQLEDGCVIVSVKKLLITSIRKNAGLA
jgi:hypothetical protein